MEETQELATQGEATVAAAVVEVATKITTTPWAKPFCSTQLKDQATLLTPWFLGDTILPWETVV